MASIHQLRQLERRPASARGRLSPFWQRLSLLLLACTTALGTVVVHVLTHRHAGSATTFLDHRLGAPRVAADLVRVTPEGYRIVIGKHTGFVVGTADGAVHLAGRNGAASEWRGYAHGLERATSYGRETITAGPGQVEQFLTVNHRRGVHTWAWDLGFTRGVHLTSRFGGSLLFGTDRQPRAYQLMPPTVLDTAGRPVTPIGLHWGLARRGDRLRLLLRLDDRSLSKPYVIDPAITFDATLLRRKVSDAAGALRRRRHRGLRNVTGV